MIHASTSERRVSGWLILAIVSLPVFIGALDLTIISAVLPEVIISLELPVKEYLDQASWAVNGYLIAYAISMTFTGRISDLIGRRSVYIGCLLIFMVGSYLITAYDNPTLNEWITNFYYDVLNRDAPRLAEQHLYLVIAGRVVQAFGAGAMVPVTIALAGDLFPPERRAKPVGMIGAVDTLGWVLGHLYGGVMVRFFGANGDRIVDAFDNVGLAIDMPTWETLFLLNIPISA
ncbi:MAG: MFS transporter, partial [Anaerolineae bacterium]|nr:MFS transporter [Anaerolineae bacterium]